MRDYSQYINSTGTHYISNSGSDEKGKYHGGKAGDQTGKEWRLRSWYSRPWTHVLRYPDPEARKLFAEISCAAALNNKVGYDQYQRYTYHTQLMAAGWNPENITTACEQDCTAGVTANWIAVGNLLNVDALKKLPKTITSRNMRKQFKAAGFEVLTAKKYLSGHGYLLPGDVLLYESHHAAANVTSGKYAVETAPLVLGCRILKKGMSGADVRELQMRLIELGYDCGKYGADGDFGSDTLKAVKAFQKDKALEVDGEAGPLTIAAMAAANPEPAEPETPVVVEPEPIPADQYPVHRLICDISDNQGKIDFDQMKADYVIARAVCGTEKDTKFDTYAKGLESHDIPYGAYLFTKCNTDAEAWKEAEAFNKAVSGFHPRTLWIDVEGSKSVTCSDKERRACIKTLVSTLRSMGYNSIGLYTGQNRYNNNLWRIHDTFDLIWIATWGANDGYVRVLPDAPEDVCLHQYTSYGNAKKHNKVPFLKKGVRLDMDRPAQAGMLEKLTGRTYYEPTFWPCVKTTKKTTVYKDIGLTDELGTAGKSTVWETRPGSSDKVTAIWFDGQAGFVLNDVIKEA